MIAHIVLFEPKASTTAADRDAFLEVMRAAFEGIPSVTRAFVGHRQLIGAGYESILGDNTYSYASVLEFEGLEELQAYLAHPLHSKLGQLFWQNCERTMIVDVECFWADTKKIANNGL